MNTEGFYFLDFDTGVIHISTVARLGAINLKEPKSFTFTSFMERLAMGSPWQYPIPHTKKIVAFNIHAAEVEV